MDKGAKEEGFWSSDIRLTLYVVCQNGTLEALLCEAVTPPFPLRAPTVSPPCPLPTRKVTLSVPFWHSSEYSEHSKAGGVCGVPEEAFSLDVCVGGGPPAGVQARARRPRHFTGQGRAEAGVYQRDCQYFCSVA